MARSDEYLHDKQVRGEELQSKKEINDFLVDAEEVKARKQEIADEISKRLTKCYWASEDCLHISCAGCDEKNRLPSFFSQESVDPLAEKFGYTLTGINGNTAEEEMAVKSRGCMVVDESCVGVSCKGCPTIHDDDLDDCFSSSDCPGCPSPDGECETCNGFDESTGKPWPDPDDCESPADQSPEPRERFHADCHPANCPDCDWRDLCPESSTAVKDSSCRSVCQECPNRCDISKEMAAEAAKLTQEEDKELNKAWEKEQQDYNQYLAQMKPDEEKCELECELCASGCQGCPVKNLETFPPVDRLQS